MTGTPYFSVVTPVYNPPLDALRAAIASVVAQDERDWELILIDDSSPAPRVLPVLRAAAAADPRVHVIERTENGHIVRASNDGVDAAHGQFIVLLDHDDLLAAGALRRVREEIDADPEIDYLYSDEDKVDPDGRHYDEFRKPDWSPERMRGQNYTSHLSVLRAAVVREVGGFHEGFDGSQDHDLFLRVTERARRIVHIPEVLYHWRVVPGSAAGVADAKPYAWVAGKAAVQAHLDRLGIPAVAEFGRWTGCYHIRREPWTGIRVSVIIPTRGSDAIVWGERRVLVVEAVRSLVAQSTGPDLEVVVVYDAVTPEPVLTSLREIAGDRLVLVRYDRPFNFSEKCNLGAMSSSGDVLVLMNDDLEFDSHDAIADLVAPLREPDVGVTGGCLLYSGSTIQHAGLACYGRHLVHVLLGTPDDNPGPFAALTINRECSALTGALLAVRRTVYEEVGGLTELLPVNFNDVDLCLKAARLGYRRVWIAGARAFHFESMTRKAQVFSWEADFMWNRWDLPQTDPYMPGHWHA